MNDGFLAFLTQFKDEGPSLLLLVDRNNLIWLKTQFEQLAQWRAAFEPAMFSLGDGKPINSDGRVRLTISLVERAEVNKLIRVAVDRFTWHISQEIAQTCAEALSNMLEDTESANERAHQLRAGRDTQASCHQYFDPLNKPPAPGIIVSFGEYDVETIREIRRGQ